MNSLSVLYLLLANQGCLNYYYKIALADRFSRSAYHPGHTSSVHIYRLLHGRGFRDANLVIPRPVMNEVMISSLPRLRIHTRARRSHTMPVSCPYLEGPLLAIVQLGNSVFSMGTDHKPAVLPH